MSPGPPRCDVLLCYSRTQTFWRTMLPSEDGDSKVLPDVGILAEVLYGVRMRRTWTRIFSVVTTWRLASDPVSSHKERVQCRTYLMCRETPLLCSLSGGALVASRPALRVITHVTPPTPRCPIGPHPRTSPLIGPYLGLALFSKIAVHGWFRKCGRYRTKMHYAGRLDLQKFREQFSRPYELCHQVLFVMPESIYW